MLALIFLRSNAMRFCLFSSKCRNRFVASSHQNDKKPIVTHSSDENTDHDAVTDLNRNHG